MIENLVQRLRSFAFEERRAAAIDLAKTGTDEAVAKLVRMVEADIRDYTPRTFRTIWQKRPIFYSYEDQLISVTALGETRNQKALCYLESIYQPCYSEIRKKVDTLTGGTDYDGYPFYSFELIKVQVTKFPKVKGELGKSLEYKLELEYVRYEGDIGPHHYVIERIPREKSEHKRKQILDEEPHKEMINAIQSLRTAIQHPHNT